MATPDMAGSPQAETVLPTKCNGESRRLAILKRMGLFTSNTKGASILRAVALEDLLGAYRLVHEMFVEEGYMIPRLCGLRVRCYEALPETATFVAKAGEAVVGVQSLVVDTPDLLLPSDSVFHAEIDALRGPYRLVCEATNEAVASDFRRSGVPTELMRCLFAHSLAVGCTDLVTGVSPGHAGFYEFIGFEQIGSVRNYSEELEDPVVLMRWDLDALPARFAKVRSGDADDEAFLKPFCYEGNPYHRQVAQWAVQAENSFHDPELLTALFVRNSDLFARCDEAELDAIRRQWGHQVFEQVAKAATEALSVGV
jgi:ribosomal protein S18 acetylase RimI-like enzyme